MYAVRDLTHGVTLLEKAMLRRARRRMRAVIRNHPGNTWRFEHDHDGWSKTFTERGALLHTHFIGRRLRPDHRVAMRSVELGATWSLARLADPSPLRNPLRDVWGLQPGRIDQGVDYECGGPFYAIGPAVIKIAHAHDSGWPGGGVIVYEFLPEAGPQLEGKCVYYNENVSPAVSVGQHVTPDVVIGFQHQGYPHCETGWWDLGANRPLAQKYILNPDHGNTRLGYNFNSLMVKLGAPSGALQGEGITGALPPGWPTDWKV